MDERSNNTIKKGDMNLEESRPDGEKTNNSRQRKTQKYY